MVKRTENDLLLACLKRDQYRKIDTGSWHAKRGFSQAATSDVAASTAAPEPAPPVVEPVSGADLELGDAAPVPMACSLDDPDCEACQ